MRSVEVSLEEYQELVELTIDHYKENDIKSKFTDDEFKEIVYYFYGYGYTPKKCMQRMKEIEIVNVEEWHIQISTCGFEWCVERTIENGYLNIDDFDEEKVGLWHSKNFNENHEDLTLEEIINILQTYTDDDKYSKPEDYPFEKVKDEFISYVFEEIYHGYKVVFENDKRIGILVD